MPNAALQNHGPDSGEEQTKATRLNDVPKERSPNGNADAEGTPHPILSSSQNSAGWDQNRNPSYWRSLLHSSGGTAEQEGAALVHSLATVTRFVLVSGTDSAWGQLFSPHRASPVPSRAAKMSPLPMGYYGCMPMDKANSLQEGYPRHLQGWRTCFDGPHVGWTQTSEQSKARYSCEIQGLRFSISLGLTTKAMQCLLQKLGLNRCFQMCLATLVALSVLLNFTV